MTRQLDRTLTNKVWRTDEDTVLKFLPTTSWTVHIINLILLCFLNFDLYSHEDRYEAEKNAGNVLERLGIRAPSVVREDHPFLEFDRIDGDPLPDVLATASPQECRRLGRKKGEELRTLHEHGSAYVDARVENTLVNDGDLYSIDHELFREDAARFHMEMDLITLTATAKLLPTSAYSPFLKGLRDGYPELFHARYSFRTIMSGISGLGYAFIVEQHPAAILTVWKNWVHDLQQLPLRA